MPVPAAPEWILGPVGVSGLLDAHYSLNFNHPASGVNALRNFDTQADRFSLNMLKLTLNHTPAPFGFRVDLGFGHVFDMIHSTEKVRAFRYIEQAYGSYKPPGGNGLQLDAGAFVTAAGAEVIETNGNWNYSRSLLFSYAIPCYHFGLRATMPFGSHFNGGVYLVNGWNNVEDNNGGKTVGLMGAFTSKKLTWTHTYHVGPEKNGLNHGLRQLYDTTMLLTPHGKASFYVNFDYGQDRRVAGGRDRWVGIAGAGRFAVNRWFAVAQRLEWFNDATGFTTGTVQKIKEVTTTAEVALKGGLVSRLEYRRDWSNTPFFDRGNDLAGRRNQDTLLLGFVVVLAPGR